MSTVKAASKVLDVLKKLRGRSLKGATVKEISDDLNMPPSQAFRALQTLIDAGFATQLDDGSYALGNALIQIAYAHAEEIDRAQGRINEHLQRVLAGVRQIQGA